jgi:hypothetical protein
VVDELGAVNVVFEDAVGLKEEVVGEEGFTEGGGAVDEDSLFEILTSFAFLTVYELSGVKTFLFDLFHFLKNF